MVSQTDRRGMDDPSSSFANLETSELIIEDADSSAHTEMTRDPHVHSEVMLALTQNGIEDERAQQILQRLYDQGLLVRPNISEPIKTSVRSGSTHRSIELVAASAVPASGSLSQPLLETGTEDHGAGGRKTYAKPSKQWVPYVWPFFLYLLLAAFTLRSNNQIARERALAAKATADAAAAKIAQTQAELKFEHIQALYDKRKSLFDAESKVSQEEAVAQEHHLQTKLKQVEELVYHWDVSHRFPPEEYVGRVGHENLLYAPGAMPLDQSKRLLYAKIAASHLPKEDLERSRGVAA